MGSNENTVLAEAGEIERLDDPAVRIEMFDFQTQVAWPCAPLS